MIDAAKPIVILTRRTLRRLATKPSDVLQLRTASQAANDRKTRTANPSPGRLLH